ncbi:hypothetical protein A3E46_00640 [Candidatus Woesebacteria bacterium RIFCSPHIGHO2_12_FULL_46_16]|uniref:Peptidase M50 domain-containing protein n=1 Tax=Candidatus Woesebacteria bacterium RIFCSPHIGHO2_12_FULL_46_16 TaxID=1802513 RepID=A0A1F8B1X8_9BACT|nr:MAG: hypothetical protein A3E46_00640 [Candidatus Woesebacteria bacterium RIFCSPHIGHO2_12_FULL_46_16]
MIIIIWLLAFAVAITIHEAAHAWMADRLGDPTPRLMGRLSLNPIVHYDPVGTTLLLGLVILRAFGVPVIPFGWAKPVRFDPYNLKNPRRDTAMISLAGPAANLVLATILSLLLRLTLSPFSPLNFLSAAFYPFIILNVALAIFNLIPIHPLDGGKVLVGLLPGKEAREADIFLSRYGILLLLFLIFPFGGISIMNLVISPLINFVLNLLIPGSLAI